MALVSLNAFLAVYDAVNAFSRFFVMPAMWTHIEIHRVSRLANTR